MRLLITFSRSYPWQSVFMLLALLFAGLAEGIGLSALLPLLSIAIGREHGLELNSDAGHDPGRYYNQKWTRIDC